MRLAGRDRDDRKKTPQNFTEQNNDRQRKLVAYNIQQWKIRYQEWSDIKFDILKYGDKRNQIVQ